MTLTTWEREELSLGNEALFQRLMHDHLDIKYPTLKYFHSGDPRRDHQGGFPDLVIVGKSILYAELKSENGRFTLEQLAWKDKLLQSGAAWTVWRPADWKSGRIDRELEALR